jgi:hypothetical protein
MQCIFCEDEILNSSVEHIVPESLGNRFYIIEPGIVCNACNNRFSEDEGKAILKSFLGFIRIQNGIKTKQGKSSKAMVDGIKAIGDPNFRKNVISFESIKEEYKKILDPSTGTFELYIPDFDKTEVSASRMLLKIAYESIYKSKRGFLGKYDFTSLKSYLTNKDNKNWPFITSHIQPHKFISIPTFNDKYELNRIKISLSLFEWNTTTLLFDFRYDYYNLTINLLNRDYLWSKPYFELDTSATLYPKYLNIRKEHPNWNFKRP